MLLTLTSVAGLLLVVVVIRRIWFHPLSQYPGPWLGKCSDILDLLAIFQGCRTFRQHKLLIHYGDVVRVGTNHLVYADVQSWADIYGPSSNPCLKDPKIYSGFSVLGDDNLLSATDRGVHGRLRRLLAHGFSARGLADAEQFVESKVQQYVDITMGATPGQPVDLLDRTYDLFLDIVSWLSFGQSFDCLGDQSPGTRRDVSFYFSVVPLLSFLPVLRYVPLPTIREGLRGVDRLVKFSSRHVDAFLAKGGTEVEGSGAQGTLLSNLANAIDPETGSRLTRDDLIEHGILFLAAGSGTTAATLTFLLWECGKNAAVRVRLAEEIRTAFPDANIRPSYDTASKLPFLGCVIAETLRLWGPLSGSAPRVSPGKAISGRWVPRGTIVETNAYTTARNPSIFNNPLTFNPSRWETSTTDMRKMSRPFSYGPRNCIGQHLAQMGIALAVCRVYQLYDAIPTAEMDSEYMRQEDKGVLEPKFKHFYVTPFAKRTA